MKILAIALLFISVYARAANQETPLLEITPISYIGTIYEDPTPVTHEPVQANININHQIDDEELRRRRYIESIGCFSCVGLVFCTIGAAIIFRDNFGI